MKNELKVFEDTNIRSVYDEEKEKWFFSVVDIIAVLTDAFKELIFPFIGMSTRKSHFSLTIREIPSPSEPITKTVGISYFISQ